VKRIPSLSHSQPQLGGWIKKCGVSGESFEEESMRQETRHERHGKDFRTRQLLRTAIKENSFLKHLDSEQLRDLVDFMIPLHFQPKQTIIREGESGKAQTHQGACASIFVTR